MNLFGYTISRAVMGTIGIVLIVALFAFGASQCAKRRSEAAQGRTDAAQAEAASNSAADAIGTVARSADDQAASEQLTRDNERAIRAANGSDARVAMDAHAAGLRALCRRKSYADAPRCAPFKGETK